MKTTVYLVPHTHWDRAWYVPFEEFRLRLLEMIDGLCRTLETDPRFTCFTLDGQAIALEDYLQVRPQNAERIRALVRARRLFVGPWYVLPDEFLVSPESLVRNLIVGRRIAESFGHAMDVGYVPDPFGHIAQLPQILRGFGIDSFIFFRGIDQQATDLPIEFLWRAPDGSAVIASQQRPFYGNGTHLGYTTNWGDTEAMVRDDRLAVDQIKKMCALLRERSVAKSLLLGNGIDQASHQPELPKLLKRIAGRIPEYDVRIASFEDYVAALRRELNDDGLRVVDRELGYRYGDMLHGVYSSRMYMKIANQHCEDLLEKWTEPVSTAAWLTGRAEYPKDELDYAWRELMKTHPHDDVCSASTDQVHREGETRLAAVEQVGRGLYRSRIRRLALGLDHSRQPGVPVMLFNTLPWPRKEVVTVDVDLNPFDEPWSSVALFDEDGREAPCEFRGVERVQWWEAIKPMDAVRHRFDVEVDLPPFGYRTLYAREGKPSRVAPRIQAAPRRFENEHFTLAIADNGSLRLADKATGQTYRDLLIFEDTEDCGDEYNWSYLARGSQTFTTAASRPAIDRVHKGPLSATWRIVHDLRVPESLTADRKARSKTTAVLRIESEVTCRAGSPRVDVVTRVDNNVRDHRLRALFPVPIHADTVHADGHFAVVERSVIMPPATEKLPPYPTLHQLRFADFSDGDKGFAILNDGLPEFEVVCDGPRRTLAQTLFRAVGWLSRDDYPTRPFSAGPTIACPEAQCLRPMEFRYGFMAHAGGWEAVMQEAHRHNIDVCMTRCDIHGGTDLRQMGIELDEERLGQKYRPVPREGELPDRACLMDIGSGRLVLSAFKRCEWNNHLVVRLYNPGAKAVRGTLKLFKPIKKAYAVNLYEKDRRPLDLKKGALPYTCPGYAIVTFELAL